MEIFYLQFCSMIGQDYCSIFSKYEMWN